MDLDRETALATAMVNTFGREALQRASDNAYIESLMSNEAGAASWRRTMVLIRDLMMQGRDMDRHDHGRAA